MNTWLNLKDNVIIVTGGASGIGLAIVDELLSQGAHVQMIDIHGNDSNLLIVFYVQIMPDDLVMQLHRF
ncbi:Sorbitol-6-phosphate 2-dehydrogenase [Klebsiella pneumoniae]|nr:Sorbitol-6-phosphate 2-dehydrogenase [Klebsiella pneumoniae]